jgi:hypothetical protein
MSALWGAATCKLVGAGVDSPRMARDLATLVGQHDVPVRSITLGEGRGTSENISLRRQDILEAADIAALGQGLALLLTSGNRPALLRLRNWFTGPDAGRVQAEVDLALRRIQDGAAARGQAGL